MSNENNINLIKTDIDLFMEEQRTFWNFLHDIVELAGDQFTSKRAWFLESEKEDPAEGGSVILSVVLIVGFAAFPVHSIAASMLIKGISKSRSIQKMVDANVIYKLSKLSDYELKKINSTNFVEYEQQAISRLKNVTGDVLKALIVDQVKKRIKAKNVNRNKPQKKEFQLQSEGIVIVKKGLYGWISAHSNQDMKELIRLRGELDRGKLTEVELKILQENMSMLLEKTNKTNKTKINNDDADDFQLLIEAAIWSATYDFFPGYREGKVKGGKVYFRTPIKVPKNDQFWEYLIGRFIYSGLMARLHYGKAQNNLIKENKYNKKDFENNVRNVDTKKMRSAYSMPTKKAIGGPDVPEILIHTDDEERLLLTYYFSVLADTLDKMQSKIIKSVASPP